VTHSRSSDTSNPVRRVFGIGLIALVALPLTIGGLRTSGRIIVPADDVVREDLYAMGGTVIIDGTIEGDLFVMAGEVRVTGAVTGDIVGLVGGPLEVSGTVGGSIRAAAVTIDVSGIVGDDLAAASIETTILGSIGRDVLVVSGETEVFGRVGRDLLTQSVRLTIDGFVGKDVEARVDTMSLGPDADVAGDVQYQATADATVDAGASVAGLFTRRDVLSPVWAKAVTRVVSILSLAGLIVAGLLAAWLFRGTSEGAVAEVERHPWRSAAVGLGALLLFPILLIPLFLTLVGIPVGLLLLVLWAIAIVLGPIPAVTRFGEVLLRGRGGLAGGLLVGAIVWRTAMWLLPLVAGIVYLAALLVGLGAYVSAGWELRRSHAV
jgi:cytoskeletal protein CcmA (bactofilin family)